MKKFLLFIAIAFIGMNANAQAPSNGLVAYYNFENTLASHVPAHSFTNVGSSNLTYTTSGKSGSCANFLGAQALLNTSMVATGNLETYCTIAWWEFRNVPTPTVGATSFQMKDSFLYNYSGSSSCSGTTYTDRYQAYWITLNGSYSNYGCATVNTHTAGNSGVWVHHALVKDGSKLYYYMNGVLSWTPVSGIDLGTAVFNHYTSNNFVLGSAIATPLGSTVDLTKNVSAKIDELYIYSRALSGTEVLAVKNTGTTVTTPLVSNVGHTSTTTDTKIYYTINASGAATTSVINYGLSAGTLSNQIVGGSASGIFDVNLNTTIPLFAGSTIYYQIKATNAVGDSFSAINSFVVGTMNPVVRFPFDNNSISSDNTYTLSPVGTSATPTYTNNRFGEANKAMYLNNNLLFTDIPVLPVNRNPRTVTFWAKRVAATQQSIFGWGSTTSGNAFGAWINGGTFINYAWGAGYDYSFALGTSTATWDHYAITYDGRFVRLYLNGVLKGTADTNSLMISTTITNFRIGSYTGGSGVASNMYLDDFEVFNSAISEQGIYGLYADQNSNALSIKNFNTNTLKATVYPNPTSNQFTIETENELKSVEIYSLLGQKVLSATSKAVNVSGLTKGIYMVRIEDANNAVSTQKMIVE